MVAVSIGTVGEGFTFTGPFVDRIAAEAFVNTSLDLAGIMYEIVELLEPLTSLM